MAVTAPAGAVDPGAMVEPPIDPVAPMDPVVPATPGVVMSTLDPVLPVTPVVPGLIVEPEVPLSMLEPAPAIPVDPGGVFAVTPAGEPESGAVAFGVGVSLDGWLVVDAAPDGLALVEPPIEPPPAD